MSMRTFTKHMLCFLFLTAGLLLVNQLQAQSTPDPGLPGPYAVTKAFYNLGDLAFAPPTFPVSVEVRGSVHYPSTLSPGPFPVLFFMHGRHTTTYQTSNPSNTSLSWPPAAGFQSITSFEGYDTLARLMASHGYIVISISCNAINATDNSTPDRGMQARGELLQHHMDLWNSYNTSASGPFGTLFNGKLNMNNIGTMGHSRGGEGVVYNALYNRSLGSPYGIKAVLTLAPVDFYRRILNGIPLLNIAPYCDGDVTSLSGVRYYDDSRYNDPSDSTAKYSVLMMGANHNFYNTVWTPGSYIAGTSDDWNSNYGSTANYCGSAAASSKRLTAAKQLAALNTYAAAFFRQYIGLDTSFAPILEVRDIIPPLSSRLDTEAVFVSFHPPINKRLDVNRIDTSLNISINSLADSAKQNGLLIGTICGGGLSMASCGISTATAKEPHKGSTTAKGMAQMNMKWNNASDYYQNKIPVAFSNISNYGFLQYRAAVNYAEYTTNIDLNYSIQLIDSIGNISSVQVKNYTRAMFLQQGTSTGVLPKIMFNTISIPLQDFSGVNLTKVKYVRFLFDQSSAGAMLIGDLTFAGAAPPPCGNIQADFTADSSGTYLIAFRDTSSSNFGDLLSWQWNFGDTASGTSNTSNLEFPNHMYSDDGVFNTCLYINILRSSGVNCQDTFCKNISIANLCNQVDAHYSYDSTNAYLVNFSNESVFHPSQTASWLWNFGDTSISALDSSSSSSPSYTYSNDGFFNACLYMDVLQINGSHCYDTFCSSIAIENPCRVNEANFTADSIDVYEMLFNNNASFGSSDIVSWYWDFGDTAVGAIDTSTLSNPMYMYTGPGSYQVCLFMTSNSARGFVCQDTFCSTITVNEKYIDNTGIIEATKSNIQIFPNPATDYLFVSGVQNNDQLTLYSTLGDLLFSSSIQQHMVKLPVSISSGIYIAVIETKGAREYKSIFIQR